MFKNFFLIDNTNSNKLRALFYSGVFILLFISFSFGNEIAYLFGKNELIKNSSSIVVNRVFSPNYLIGILAGIFIFVISTVLWRLLSPKIYDFLKHNDNENIKSFIKLGNFSVDKLIHTLFYIGIIFIIIQGFFYINILSRIPIIPAFIGFILMFILSIIIWKIICELLLIFFRAFETYYNKNKK